MDILSVSERSQRIRKVRSKATRPELLMRKLLFHKCYGYRLHVKKLAGKPDIVFVGRRTAIFVHVFFGIGVAREQPSLLAIKNTGKKNSQEMLSETKTPKHA